MKRGLLIALAAAVLLVAAAGLLFAFGTPQAPRTPAVAPAVAGESGAPATEAPAMSSAASQPGSDGDPSARGKTAPPADPNSPLAIQIPGCVCHSDDPKLVEEHADYRMNQCAGCHVGGTPTGQE